MLLKNLVRTGTLLAGATRRFRSRSPSSDGLHEDVCSTYWRDGHRRDRKARVPAFLEEP